MARHGAVLGRLRFAMGPYMVIDLLAIAPFYLSLIMPAADLRVLRIIFVPTVVQCLACPSETNGGNQLQVEPGLPKVMRQWPMIVAGRLEPDPHWQAVAGKNRGQALEILQRVQDRHAPTPLLARDPNQDLVAVLGNVDRDQDSRRNRMGGGHSVLRTLSGVVQQNHC